LKINPHTPPHPKKKKISLWSSFSRVINARLVNFFFILLKFFFFNLYMIKINLCSHWTNEIFNFFIFPSSLYSMLIRFNLIFFSCNFDQFGYFFINVWCVFCYFVFNFLEGDCIKKSLFFRVFSWWVWLVIVFRLLKFVFLAEL
jgi:hypothetical protein